MPGAGPAPQLDLLGNAQIIELLLGAEERVVPAVRAAAPAIAEAAELVAERMLTGGRVVFVGAGTSGRLAVAEAAELPGTFGLPADRVIAVLAGGGRHNLAGTDRDEDDCRAAVADLAAVAITAGDVVIAVAASGRTPYTVAAARAAITAGAPVIAVVNVPASPLSALAAVAIEVPVGDEVLRGSTRLTAGTAQKIALNAVTTIAMTRAGRVHGNLMVDVVADNTKLRHRAAGIVAEIAGCTAPDAWDALEMCRWNARAAVLYLVAGLAPEQAAERAAAHPSLRAALAER